MAAAPRILVSAGEPSGDQHAAHVVAALLRRRPDALVEAFGGPALEAAGARVRDRMEGYTVMGFVEALAAVPAHLRLLGRLRQDLRRGAYDLVILVDYPGFNLRLASAAHEAGVRTLYYVAPQLWAWRPGRARRLAAAVDRMAVILPFEPEFFQRHGIRAEFVGHPLVERSWPDRTAARAALGLPAGDRVLALFPGSRGQEVHRMWPPFRDAAAQVLAQGHCDRVVVATTEAGDYPGAERFSLISGKSASVLAAADAALLKSGTSTLEAAMVGTPAVVAYRTHPLSMAVARRVVTVPWMSLVNLVAGHQVLPELVQEAATADRLLAEVVPLLDPSSEVSIRQRRGLAEVRNRLGTPGAADRVAAMVDALLAA